MSDDDIDTRVYECNCSGKDEEPEKVQGPIDSPVSDDGLQNGTYVKILTCEYNAENEHETEM